jgi:hypothetical protein
VGIQHRNSELLQTNLEVLEDRFPLAAHQVRSADFPLRRQIVPGRESVLVYQAEIGGTFVNLTSRYDPYKEARLQLREIDWEQSDIIFIFGEAGLYHLEVALDMATDKHKLVFISRSASNFKLVLASRDLRTALTDERLVLSIADDDEAVSSVFNRILSGDIYTLSRFTWFTHPFESKVESKEMVNFERLLRSSAFTSLLNFNTRAYFEKEWSENYILNLPHLLSGKAVKDLTGSWAHRPAIVVGAGPSLNKNISLLSEFRDKALILCTDTAYKALQKHGIKPTVIVTLDGGEANYKNMQGCTYEDIPLLMDVYTHPKISKASKAAKIVLKSHDLHGNWWRLIKPGSDSAHAFSTGGSVATASFNFARLIGADPIILVGEDLSYPNGQVYAEGTVNASRTLEDVTKLRQLLPVENQAGETLYTTNDYLYYLRWFEDQAKHTQARCINATEGGALHRGFELQTLAETLERDCAQPQPVDNWRQGIVSSPVDTSTVESVRHTLVRSKRELCAANKVLLILVHYAQQYVDLLKDDQDVELKHIFEKLQKGEALLNKYPLAMAFLDGYSFSTIRDDIRFEKNPEASEEQDDTVAHVIKSAENSLKLFRGLRERCAESAAMHRSGLEWFDQYFKTVREGVGLNEYASSVSSD